MEARITQVGTSVGVIIPKYISAEGGFLKGVPVNIEFEDEKIVITKVKERRKGWEKAFEKFAKENSNELLLPDFLDDEAMDLL